VVSENETPVLIALGFKDTECTSYLVSRGANLLLTNSFRESALALVCKHALSDVFQCVADRSSPVVNMHDIAGNAPLHIALKNG
jgi:ankyrin repeat protein